jgi:hypothetical protein
MSKNKLLQIFCVGLFLFFLILMHSCVSVEDIARDDRFIAHHNGVVKDTRTGFEWIAGPDKDTNWYKAKRWVENLTVDGGGWRMPTIEELKTLYLKGADNITPLLKTTGLWVWSREMRSSSTAWLYRWRRGDQYWGFRSSPGAKRGFAVRSQKVLSKKEMPDEPVKTQTMRTHEYTQKTEREKRTEELVSEIVEEKFKKNTLYVLCDQPSYLLCFGIPREQCIGELTEYNPECYNKAKEKVSGPLTIEKNAENFVTIVFMCMMFKHIAAHAENAQEIGECFDKASFDETTAVRSLLK